MTQTITATFEDGVLKPMQALDLPEHAQVRLTIEPMASDKSVEEKLAAWDNLMRIVKRTPVPISPATNCMNGIDTNILVYSVDKKEPVKQPKADQLIRQLIVHGGTVLPWQVLVKSIQQLRRWQDRGDLKAAEFDQHAQEFRNIFPVVFPTIRVLDHPLDLVKRYSLSHWDSMILGACKEAGVTSLYTEDMGAPTVIDGIQLINPVL